MTLKRVVIAASAFTFAAFLPPAGLSKAAYRCRSIRPRLMRGSWSAGLRLRESCLCPLRWSPLVRRKGLLLGRPLEWPRVHLRRMG